MKMDHGGRKNVPRLTAQQESQAKIALIFGYSLFLKSRWINIVHLPAQVKNAHKWGDEGKNIQPATKAAGFFQLRSFFHLLLYISILAETIGVVVPVLSNQSALQQ